MWKGWNPKALNWAHMGLWTGIFVTMLSTNAIGNHHPGLSIAFWRKACAEQRVDACRNLRAILRDDCTDGVVSHCELLGELLEMGEITSPDPQEAGQAFSAACEGHVPDGCGHLAELARDGKGIPKNPMMAATLYALACENGYGLACVPGATMFRDGDGIPADAERAASLLNTGCNTGDGAACQALAGVRGSLHDDRARKCDGGDGAACTALAMEELNPANPNGDHPEAARRLEAACRANDAAGCANLGRMRQIGDGIPRDPDGAATAFQRACTLGFKPACNEAGTPKAGP
jgi:TPR repeat protein